MKGPPYNEYRSAFMWECSGWPFPMQDSSYCESSGSKYMVRRCRMCESPLPPTVFHEFQVYPFILINTEFLMTCSISKQSNREHFPIQSICVPCKCGNFDPSLQAFLLTIIFLIRSISNAPRLTHLAADVFEGISPTFRSLWVSRSGWMRFAF